MPPPADLENAAPLLPKITQLQNRSNATSKKITEGSKLGRGLPSHRVPQVMVWKCTMSQSVFCYVPVQWREKTGEARELMKWLHSGREGKEDLTMNSWQKPLLFNTVLQCPGESRLKSDEKQKDALHPSLVLQFSTKSHNFITFTLHSTSWFSTPDWMTTSNQLTV